MATPFARLQQRVNNALRKHLPNATATWTPAGGGAGVDADVIFDEARGVISDQGVVVQQPVLELLDVSLWPGAAEGDAVAIDGVSYVVRSAVPDGDGEILVIALARS